MCYGLFVNGKLSCLKINLNNKYVLHRFKGRMGVSFHFHYPKDAQACYRPQRVLEDDTPIILFSIKDQAVGKEPLDEVD